jgi:hypothetical protein
MKLTLVDLVAPKYYPYKLTMIIHGPLGRLLLCVGVFCIGKLWGGKDYVF